MNLKQFLKRHFPVGAASAPSTIASTPVAEAVIVVSPITIGELRVYHPVTSNITLAPLTVKTLVSMGDSAQAPAVDSSTGDANTSNTADLRPQDQPEPEKDAALSMSANSVSFPVGLTWLDIDRHWNIRIDASAEPISPDSVKIHLGAWGDTILYSAGCTWLTVYANDPDFQFGKFSTTDDHPLDKPQMQTKRKITFPKPFQGEPPKVIVWLNELHMSNRFNWRCKAYVTDITAESFIIHIDTWASTTLYSATASWFAYPFNRTNISSGSFNTMDVRPWYIPIRKNKGTAKFHQKFESIPRVLAGLNWLDFANLTNMRLKLEIGDISTRGLTWHLDAWSDTILYSAGASYVAILDS